MIGKVSQENWLAVLMYCCAALRAQMQKNRIHLLGFCERVFMISSGVYIVARILSIAASVGCSPGLDT